MKEKKEKAVTIDHVAQAANVSKTTVSRYLNHKYEYMSAETKQRIQQVISNLEYHPSNIARSLKSRYSKTIGCVIADIANPFSSILLKGINDVCKSAGYQVLFYNIDNQPEQELDCIQKLLDNQVDGLILNTTGYNDNYLIDLSKKGIPIVLADRSIEQKGMISTVTTENYQATYSCMKHLFENGYRRVAFFTQGNGKISPRMIRYQAYQDALRDFFSENSKPLSYVVDVNNFEDCTGQLTDFISGHKEDRNAVFAINGVTTLAVLHVIQQLGYQIGENLGVCGFDDWGWASLVPPGITTITQDSYSVGKQAASILLRQLKSSRKRKPQYIELPNQLTIRGSTDPAAAFHCGT